MAVHVGTREPSVADAAAIARIWNEGIADRVATFETEPRSAAQVEAALADGRPAVVVERGGQVVAFAWSSSYSSRACYSGISEASVYVSRAARGEGLGSLAFAALLEACAARGHWKVIGKVFAANKASLAMLKRFGFREVGVHQRHGKLDGEWLDVVLVEKLL